MIISTKYNNYKIKNLILIKNKQRRNVEKKNEIELSNDDSKYIFMKTSFSFLIHAKKIIEKVINDL